MGSEFLGIIYAQEFDGMIGEVVSVAKEDG
jgi:hypothetical protein